MVKAQSDERDAQEQQNDRPRTDISVERCGPRGAETLVKPPRKPHQTARGDQFRKVVERPCQPMYFAWDAGDSSDM